MKSRHWWRAWWRWMAKVIRTRHRSRSRNEPHSHDIGCYFCDSFPSAISHYLFKAQIGAAMSNQQHHEKTIFNAALQLPNAKARTAYLKEACGDDLPLRMRVEALLQDHPEVGSFMENPPTVVVDAAARAKTADSTDQ